MIARLYKCGGVRYFVVVMISEAGRSVGRRVDKKTSHTSPHLTSPQVPTDRRRWLDDATPIAVPVQAGQQWP